MTLPAGAPTEAGLALRVRAAPGASKIAVGERRADVDGERLLVRVTAAPEKGKANAAVGAALAKAFGVSKSSVRLTAGATDRNKTFHIDGEPDALLMRLAALLGDAP